MTPLELSILLHYRGCADDFRGGDFSAPAVREAINKFRDSWLLLEATSGLDPVAAYRLTERGEVFVDGLCKLPLPVRAWVMPENKP